MLGDGNLAVGSGGDTSTSGVRAPKLVTGDSSDRSIMQSAISGAEGRKVCVQELEKKSGFCFQVEGENIKDDVRMDV